MAKVESIIQKMLINRMMSTYQPAETKAVADIIEFVTPLFEKQNNNAITAILDILSHGMVPFPVKDTYYTYIDCIVGIALAANRLPKNKYFMFNNKTFISNIITIGLLNHTDTVALLDTIVSVDLLRYTDLSLVSQYDRLLTLLIVKDITEKKFRYFDYQNILIAAINKRRLSSCLNNDTIFLIVLLKKRKMFASIINAFKTVEKNRRQIYYEDKTNQEHATEFLEDPIIKIAYKDLLCILEKIKCFSKQYNISLENSFASIEEMLKTYKTYQQEKPILKKCINETYQHEKYHIYASKYSTLNTIDRNRRKRTIIIPKYSK